MNVYTESLRRKSHAEIAALRALEQQGLSIERTETLGTATLPLLLVTDAPPGNPSHCFFSLGAGGNVPGIAQHLPCGLLASDGSLLRARRTDRNGSFWATLSENGCRLRFVNQIRDAIDIKILEELGDAKAREQLQAARDYPELADTLRQLIEEALGRMGSDVPEPVGMSAVVVREIFEILMKFRRENEGRDSVQPVDAPVLRHFEGPEHELWRCAATDASAVGGSLAACAEDEEPEPAKNVDRISIYGDEVVVQVPADLVPYGVIRILAKVEDQLVGTCLLPLIKYETPRPEESQRYNTCLAAEVVADRNPRSVTWYVQPASKETLPWFPAAEVQELLDRRDVRIHDELQQSIRSLLELVEEREVEM